MFAWEPDCDGLLRTPERTHAVPSAMRIQSAPVDVMSSSPTMKHAGRVVAPRTKCRRYDRSWISYPLFHAYWPQCRKSTSLTSAPGSELPLRYETA